MTVRSVAKEIICLAKNIGDGDIPMGPLTDDLTRLREEMRAFRAERQAFVRSLRASVAAMRADFRDTHARMAWVSLEKRRRFVDDMAAAEQGRVAQAQASLEKRRRFVDDLASAHDAWFRPGPTKGVDGEAETPPQRTRRARRT